MYILKSSLENINRCLYLYRFRYRYFLFVLLLCLSIFHFTNGEEGGVKQNVDLVDVIIVCFILNPFFVMILISRNEVLLFSNSRRPSIPLRFKRTKITGIVVYLSFWSVLTFFFIQVVFLKLCTKVSNSFVSTPYLYYTRYTNCINWFVCCWWYITYKKSFSVRLIYVNNCYVSSTFLPKIICTLMTLVYLIQEIMLHNLFSHYFF